MCWLSISVHFMAEKSTFHLKCILLEWEATPPAFLFVIPTKEWIITKRTKTACMHLFPSLTLLLQLQGRCWKLLSPLCLPSSFHLVFKTDNVKSYSWTLWEKDNIQQTVNLHTTNTERLDIWMLIWGNLSPNLLGSFPGMRSRLDRDACKCCLFSFCSQGLLTTEQMGEVLSAPATKSASSEREML